MIVVDGPVTTDTHPPRSCTRYPAHPGYRHDEPRTAWHRLAVLLHEIGARFSGRPRRYQRNASGSARPGHIPASGGSARCTRTWRPGRPDGAAGLLQRVLQARTPALPATQNSSQSISVTVLAAYE